MFLVLNVAEFWIYQGSEYAFGFECTRILNIPEFLICQGYTGFRICRINSWICAWICLIMFGYVWKCLNMLEHAWICLSLPEWLLFYIPPFTHLFFNLFSTWTRVTYLNVYRRLQVIVWRNMKLFSGRGNIWFFE